MTEAVQNKESPQKKRNKHIWDAIEYAICRAHLYTTKGEALFKAAALLLSYFGGVWHQNTPVAYYLFSFAIIMEYSVQLIRAKRFIPKVLPCFLTVSNLVVLGFSFGQILQAGNPTSTQNRVEIITLCVIGIDAIATILFEQPEKFMIESNISAFSQRDINQN